MVKFAHLFLENAIQEGKRLEEEAANVPPYLVPDTNLAIICEGLPTMVDGKIKSLWSGNDVCTKCYLCHAGGLGRNCALQHRHSSQFKVKNRAALRYGFSPLHARMRAMDWFLKTKLNSDFKYHEAR